MANSWPTVFVTVGSTRFDKLIQRVIDDNTLEVRPYLSLKWSLRNSIVS